MNIFEMFTNDNEVIDNKLHLVDGSYLTNDGYRWLIVNEDENSSIWISNKQATIVLEY